MEKFEVGQKISAFVNQNEGVRFGMGQNIVMNVVKRSQVATNILNPNVRLINAGG